MGLFLLLVVQVILLEAFVHTGKTSFIKSESI